MQTGLRLSELTALRRDDAQLGAGAHVRVIGKGRKERITSLTKATAEALMALLREIDAGQDLVFCSARGTRLSADAVQHLVSKHVARAAQSCLSLACKHVTPQVLRHSGSDGTAASGRRPNSDRHVARHESIETTQIYLDADLRIKQAALDKVHPLGARTGRYRPDDTRRG
jgi:site-specific recombinase XerC